LVMGRKRPRGFEQHRSWAACFLSDVSDPSDTLMHHLARLQQAYLSRLPPALATDAALSFALDGGRDAALNRLAHLFDARWRRQHLAPETAKAVSRALAGPNPQGQCWKGWRLSGFGETQVCGPKAAIAHAASIIAAFRKMWRTPVVCEAVPHTILRPPGGSLLAAHIDSGSLLDMYTACQRLLDAGAASPIDWAREHGCQSLVHWEGARACRATSRDGAHTCGLSQLTTARYFVLLSMLHPDHFHVAVPPPKTVDPRASMTGSAAAYDPNALTVDTSAELHALLPRVAEAAVAQFVAKGGPIFAPFFHAAVLAALNETLNALEEGVRPPVGGATARWLDTLQTLGKLETLRRHCATHRDDALGPVVATPMCPPVESAQEPPICITWLRGWPHMANSGGVRLTFNPRLQPRPKPGLAGQRAMDHYETERQRSVRRVLLMARGKYDTIRGDPALRLPIAGGAVHSHPEQEEAMHRNFDRRAYATLKELQAYDTLTAQMNAAAAEELRCECEAAATSQGGRQARKKQKAANKGQVDTQAKKEAKKSKKKERG